MVAYGAPNRWHKRSHRGRKRCGMQFARWSVRVKLGQTKQTKYDPDVWAKRLVNADPYLAKVPYGTASAQEKALQRYASSAADVISATRSAWDIARDRYRSAGITYVSPMAGRQARGNEIRDWKAMPAGTKLILPAERPETRQFPRDSARDRMDGRRPLPWRTTNEGGRVGRRDQLKMMVRLSWTAIRSSRCRRTARERTIFSLSRPLRIRSRTGSRWLTRTVS